MHAQLVDSAPGELKEYAESLLARQPGVVLLESKAADKTHIFIASSDENSIDMKKVADGLKTFGIKGGGTQKHFQGSAETLPANFTQSLRNILK